MRRYKKTNNENKNRNTQQAAKARFKGEQVAKYESVTRVHLFTFRILVQS